MATRTVFVSDGMLGGLGADGLTYRGLEKEGFEALDDADVVAVAPPHTEKRSLGLMKRVLRYLASGRTAIVLWPTVREGASGQPRRGEDDSTKCLEDGKQAIREVLSGTFALKVTEKSPEIWVTPKCWLLQDYLVGHRPALGLVLERTRVPPPGWRRKGLLVRWRPRVSFGKSSDCCVPFFMSMPSPSCRKRGHKTSLWLFLPITKPQLSEKETSSLRKEAVLLRLLREEVEDASQLCSLCGEQLSDAVIVRAVASVLKRFEAETKIELTRERQFFETLEEFHATGLTSGHAPRQRLPATSASPTPEDDAGPAETERPQKATAAVPVGEAEPARSAWPPDPRNVKWQFYTGDRRKRSGPDFLVEHVRIDGRELMNPNPERKTERIRDQCRNCLKLLADHPEQGVNADDLRDALGTSENALQGAVTEIRKALRIHFQRKDIGDFLQGPKETHDKKYMLNIPKDQIKPKDASAFEGDYPGSL